LQVGSPMKLRNYEGVRIRSVAFTSDGTKVVSGDSKSNVIVWDFATRTKLSKSTGHTGYVRCVAFLPTTTNNSKLHVVSVSADTTIRFWEIMVDNHPRHRALEIIENQHGDIINALAVSSDGNHIYSGDKMGVVVRLDHPTQAATGKRRKVDDGNNNNNNNDND